jgi:hypothetical protein
LANEISESIANIHAQTARMEAIIGGRRSPPRTPLSLQYWEMDGRP